MTVAVVLIGSLAGPSAGAQSREFDGKVVLFGNLHAHSKLSGDITNAGAEMLPIRAFEYADQHGLDFLAITDHHKAADSPGTLRITSNDYKTKLFDVAVRYNRDHPGELIAIPGIEWGNTATGNHVNLLGARKLPPDSIKDAQYDDLFVWASTNSEFVQFNHPYAWPAKSTRNRDVGNFGEALYPSLESYRTAVDPVVKTMSIICSVAGGHLSGEHKHSEDKTHRNVHSKTLGHYRNILNKGFHVSPAANQDTHWRNWGTVTAARTAVWAASATYDHLMDGFRAGRVYATEDDEMAVVFQVRYGGRTYWMGETVSLDTDEAEVEVLVTVWQTTGTDNDPTDEGPYTVSIFSDWDGIGGRRASLWDTQPGVTAGQLCRIPAMVVPGEYIFLQVTEENGKDNLVGEGEDEYNNLTGQHGQDGKRDDLNDSAWTTPIWFTSPGTSYVWSVRSKLYHDPDCWAVSRIGAANRRTDTNPPEGKTKHDCHP
jgi:hypothetical protein